MRASQKREIRGEARDSPIEFVKHKHFIESMLCSIIQYWHQACCCLFHERITGRLFDVAGLRCGLCPKRSDDLEKLLSDFSPIYWVDPGLGKVQEKKCVMSLMSNEQKARQWVDSMIQSGNSSTSRKSLRLAQARRLEERRDRPLNVLGCFALLHAIRSINSDE